MIRRFTTRAGATFVCGLAALLLGCSAVPEHASPADPTASPATIRGLISIPKSGEPHLVGCDGGVPFTLGDMSPGSLHYVKRRFAEISRRNPGPVTAEFSGYVRKAGKGFRIDRPGLVYVAAGRCVEPEEGGYDY